ncbi:hypothetical protein DPMN_089527 [Dreissena polymorpha]|uniref:Uncharacterized protein n=1 Tax=Dreissena polymorpha TaxID=45954 RepID=A0A9D4KWM2_DREPO|nr:hypothetical protein DPMN_089527 [Dreissena polymorpha]
MNGRDGEGFLFTNQGGLEKLRVCSLPAECSCGQHLLVNKHPSWRPLYDESWFGLVRTHHQAHLTVQDRVQGHAEERSPSRPPERKLDGRLSPWMRYSQQPTTDLIGGGSRWNDDDDDA